MTTMKTAADGLRIHTAASTQETVILSQIGGEARIDSRLLAVSMDRRHQNLFELVKGGLLPFEDATWRQASELAQKNHGREVFDVTKLQPYYEAAISLCTFVAANGGVDFGKRQPEIYRWKGAPPALLALCALVLFVSDWDMNAAIAAFAKLLCAPEPSDVALGNVIGLNPFHEYGAWRLVIASGEVAAKSPNGLDYNAQLAAIEAALREQHRQWKENQH